jgi:hypothetical protein
LRDTGVSATAAGADLPDSVSVDVSEDAVVEELRRRFGELLGTSNGVSPEAFRAAVENPVYARYLMGSRGAPETVQMLLDSPPPRPAAEPSVGTLARRASKAFARWAAAGFSVVDDVTLQRRLAACGACEHLAESSQRPVERIAGLGLTDRSTCALCGCPVRRKAKLPTERCPAPHPTLSGLSRWSEDTA